MLRWLCALGVACAAVSIAGSAQSRPVIRPSLVPVLGRGSCVMPPPRRVPGCLSVDGFRSRGAVLSADGRSLYAFGGFDDTSIIRVFSRDAHTGLLTTVGGRGGCLRIYWDSRRCFPMRLNKPTAMAVSPDGRELFVSGYCCAHSFAAFRRDPRTGALVKAVCCDTDPARGLSNGNDVAVSPDGRNVYIAGSIGVAVLDRDRSSGTLTQPSGEAGCVRHNGADGCARVPAPRFYSDRVVVSPDGESVYVLSDDGGLFTFARTAATGALAAGTCFTPSPPLPACAPLPVDVGPEDVLVSGDGHNVYVVGTYGPLSSKENTSPFKAAILAFERPNPASLVPVAGSGGCVATSRTAGSSCQVVRGLVDDNYSGWGPDRDLAISPDGREVFVAVVPEERQQGIMTFRRDVAGDGGLRQSGRIVRIRGPFGDPNGMIPTRDGRYLYVGEDHYPGENHFDTVVVYRRR